MPPQTRHKGESKQGLVITLVFFILATIGLGVSTYFGFDGQEKKDQEVKKAKADTELFKKERDWYKFQAGMFRVYAGQAQTLADAESLGTTKNQFDQGTLKGGKDDEEVRKVLKDLDKRFGWNGNKPKQTYQDEIDKWKTDYETLDKRTQNVQKEVADAKDKQQKAKDELEAAQKDFGTQLAALNKTAANDKNDFEKTLKDLRESIASLTADNTKKLLAAEQQNKALGAQIKKKDDEIKQIALRLKDRDEKISELQVLKAEAPPSMRTDWQIVSMDRRGTNPYINLGSADKVKPQLTFTIHGVGLDGRPNPQPKGTLEVVNVVRDHLSQTRITSVKDANRDPILKGDILYNPSWNPTVKKHVALAGTMDLTGDGRDSLREFMRNLERQNIVVDAYLDPKDGSIKGAITLRTDYLILGESQEFSATGKEKQAGEGQKNVDAGRRQMEEDAAGKGVKVLALHKYLDLIGYRLPRGANEGRSLYNPNLRPDLTPRLGGEKPPAMKPDK